jgi:BlaI family transcriptional regulator, penicillinase repressor
VNDNDPSNQKKRAAAVENISDAEWHVAKVLWQNSPLTAAEIIEKLKDSTEWNPKTIHTLISRLAKKEIIKAQAGVTPYTYYPLVTESECAREKTRSLVDRVYNGSFSLMVSHFVKDETLSPVEIKKLKEILDKQ